MNALILFYISSTDYLYLFCKFILYYFSNFRDLFHFKRILDDKLHLIRPFRKFFFFDFWWFVVNNWICAFCQWYLIIAFRRLFWFNTFNFKPMLKKRRSICIIFLLRQKFVWCQLSCQTARKHSIPACHTLRTIALDFQNFNERKFNIWLFCIIHQNNLHFCFWESFKQMS